MIKVLKNLGKKELFFAFLCLVFIFSQVWLELKIPDYMSKITVLVKTPGTGMKDVLEQGLYMTLCALGSLVTSIIVGYFASFIAAKFGFIMRKRVFDKVENFGMEEIKMFSTSSLITRTTNDVFQVQMLIAIGLQAFIKAPIMAVWAITKIAGKGSSWTIATVVAVVFLLLVVGILMKLVLPKFKKLQKLTDGLNRVTRENLTGIRVIRAFNAEEYQTDKFESVNDDLTKTHMFIQRSMSVMAPVMTLIMSVLPLSIYLIGAFLINQANAMDKIVLFSNMVVFSSYAIQVVMSFVMLIVIFIIYPRASVSANRINEVLDCETKIKDGKISKDTTNEQGTIEFKDVSFRYPDAEEYILENISFKANKGDTVAFIGSTGSGKSTLVNLIPRFYDVSKGSILVDGVDVKEYKQEFLHNKIGYIPQKAVMFSGTVKENVLYGDNGKKDINDKELIEVLKIAQGYEFVSRMEEGINSHIAGGGTNISGGQKQRLAIARAIARHPEIYIFDDSFSALDYKTDFILRQELKKYMKDATTLIVAQRIGTIKDADKIIVLDSGKVVGEGTHKELLKNCEVYKEIALSQLSKEELENA